MKWFRVLFVPLLAAGAASAAFADPPIATSVAPLYHVTKSVPLGAPERWDYVHYDGETHRVYVAHQAEVSVIDSQSGVLIGKIGRFAGGTHGIVIVPGLHRGYTDDGKAGLAESFDTITLKRIKPTQAAMDADAVAFDLASGHVFIMNGDSQSITVIDPKTDAAITTIPTADSLEFAVADGRGKLFVNGAEKREILRIDTASNQVDARWPVPACESPHGLDMDPQSHRLFTSCLNGKLLVVDSDTGNVVATLPIGMRSDAVAFDASRKRIFSSNGDGTLSIFHEDTPNSIVPLQTMKTSIGARTMALDPVSGRLFLATADFDHADSPKTPGGRPSAHFRPGSMKLLFLDPVS